MDIYKAEIIDGQIRALKEDEYNHVQLVDPGGKNINLDEGALLLLKRYYSESDMPEAVQKLLAADRIVKRTIIKNKETP